MPNSIGSSNREQPENRRTATRVPFSSILGIADYDGTLPGHSQFRPVQGRDLSQTGIAFGIQRWPSTDTIVVMVGELENPSYATKHIVGCLRDSSGPDETQFEVRSEFGRWLKRRE